MHRDIKHTLDQILEIIGYADDKTAFVDKFMSICHKQALADLIQSLPLEKQTNLKEQMKSGDGHRLLKQYFAYDVISKTVAKAVQGQFLSFLHAIDSTLTTDQLKHLDTFIDSLRLLSHPYEVPDFMRRRRRNYHRIPNNDRIS